MLLKPPSFFKEGVEKKKKGNISAVAVCLQIINIILLCLFEH